MTKGDMQDDAARVAIVDRIVSDPELTILSKELKFSELPMEPYIDLLLTKLRSWGYSNIRSTNQTFRDILLLALTRVKDRL